MYHVVAPLVMLWLAVLRKWRGKLTGAKPTFLSLFNALSTTAQTVDARPSGPAALVTNDSNITTSSLSLNGQAHLNC